ncbi:hypothetical protein [Streptomyces chartreusis]|uniref:hypothetical protein n=1 Tax=Streptomyces chartreusis TaxID=1969 RepID=UPI0038115D59
MSSTYYLLCVSHDPAISVNDSGYNRPEEAEAAVGQQDAVHSQCDLLIARHSGALIEIGCPQSYPRREGAHQCPGHGRTEWIDWEWLRLLAVAYQSSDEQVRQTATDRGFSCWSWERLRRLRGELHFTEREG